ncbi:MAG TPA: protein kinase [Kofleriaceae bacterium]|nr:protein kinase [Kofleriaceae bacterium]
MLAGKYRVERVLGRGGMGVVVQATHLALNQPVAIKLLLPDVLGNQQVVQRFLREAQAAVRLRSEHVARVIDVGSLDTGVPYMVLEYLEGADLASFPRSQLTVGGIVDLALQACEALAEAHALGIVHRDIKPANFFLTRGVGDAPLLKVLDFGISKVVTPSGQLTASQTVMGTPAYMSPEQMHSPRSVDLRSDIWSLGIVLYELLQGVPPFRDDEFLAMALKVVNNPLPRLTVRLPGELDQIIYRCLEKDPARRFQNVADLACAISPYARSETQAAISVQRTRAIVDAAPAHAALAPDTPRRAAPSTLSGSAGMRIVLVHSGRRWPIVVVMGILAGGIAIAIVATSQRARTEASRPEGALHTASAPGPDAAARSAPPPQATLSSLPDPSLVTVPARQPTPHATGFTATPSSTAAPASTQPGTAATAPPPSVAASPGQDVVTTPLRVSAPRPREATRTSGLPTKSSASPARSASASPKAGLPAAKPVPAADDDVLGVRK